MNTNEITRFDQLGLSEKVLTAVDEMGYEEPSPVQRGAIPAVLEGRDVMAAAQTGTGKTAAFLLPTLDRLGRASKGQGVLMLVVTPTRELAQQIEACARVICKQTGHRCTVVVGGVGYEPQKAALARGCDVLIATPGRLIDLIEQGACNLSDVQVLVLDEADRMLDMGFAPAMRRIVSKTPESRQTLLFSATLGDDVLANTKSLVRDPVRVEIAHKGTAAQTIDQYMLGVAEKEKVRILTEVLKREGSRRVIVFCRGKYRADMVCRKLNKAGITAAAIHGNRSQSQRETALRRFAAGEADVLVATDVLARGIDIAEVSYVVNLDVPSDAEDYIHRIGRTGRAGQFGWALTFVAQAEYYDLRDIEQLMGKLVPDYPRAEGIDCGPDAFVLDPARKPTDKLPSKKARKKLLEQQAAAQEASDGRRPAKSAVAQAGDRPAASRRGGRAASADGRAEQGEEAQAGARGNGGRGRAAGEQAGADGRSDAACKPATSADKPGEGSAPSRRSRSRRGGAGRAAEGHGDRAGATGDAGARGRVGSAAGADAPATSSRRQQAGRAEASQAAGSPAPRNRRASGAGQGGQAQRQGKRAGASASRPAGNAAAAAAPAGKPRRRPGDHGGPLAQSRRAR